MFILPEEVNEAWAERQGPVVFSTVSAENIPNAIFVESISIVNEDTIGIANNNLLKTDESIQSGSKGGILFSTKAGVTYQIKGVIEYHKENYTFDDMNENHAAFVLKVEDVFKGSDRLRAKGLGSKLNQKKEFSLKPNEAVVSKRNKKEKLKKQKSGVKSKFAIMFFPVFCLTILIVSVLFSRGKIEDYFGIELPEIQLIEIARIKLGYAEIPFVSDWVLITDKDPRGILHMKTSDIQTYFLNNDVSGELFIVKGSVENRYKKTRSSISIKIGLISESGKILMTEIVYAGNKLSDEQLKTLDIVSIRKLLNNKSGTDNNNTKVRPNQELTFTVVFDLNSMKDSELFRQFTVEPHGSLPGE